MPELGEPQIRLLAFVGLFAVFAALELAFPRRRLSAFKITTLVYKFHDRCN